MNILLSALMNGVLLSLPLAAAAWLGLRLIPRAALNAATRYSVLWAVLVLVLLLPVFCQPRKLPPRAPAISPLMAHSVAVAEPVEADPVPAETYLRPAVIPLPAPKRNWKVIAGVIWAVATLLMLMRLIASWIVLKRRKAEAMAPEEHLRRRAGAWLAQCHCTRKIALLVTSGEIGGPMATGPWHPSILFPARLFQQFTDDEIDQIGLHETAHLARFDDFALTAQRIVEAIFFFHPAVRWIARQIDLEREIACDDFVVQNSGAPRQYAGCLTRVAEATGGIRPSLFAAAVTDENSHLSRRVEMLLDKTRHTGTRLLKPHLTAGLAALTLLAGIATEIPVLFSLATPLRTFAQTAAPPAAPPKGPGMPAYVTPGPAAAGTPGSFAIKRAKPEIVKSPADDGTLKAAVAAAPRFTTATITPVEWHMGGVVMNSSPGKIDYKMVGIKSIFFKAWPIANYRFVWPDWLTEPSGNINAWYDISATMPADTTPERLQLMWQALLADHFKMAAHFETKTMDIYALKIAPGGIKFGKSSDPSNPGWKGIGSQDGWHTVPRLPRQSATDPSGMTLTQFTQDGSAPGLLDRPLVDMTGLEGVYDIDLTIPRDPNTPWPMQPIRGPSTAAERAANQGWRNDVFFKALETQLGLTAELQSVPTQMLVVDDLDVVPTAN